MIIVGAKGFAKEILQVISVDMGMEDENIVFFDNVNDYLPDRIFGRFRILKSIKEVEKYLSKHNDKNFVIGLGNPNLRRKLYNQFVKLGAVPKTVISKNAEIGSFDVSISQGTTIMSGAKISNSVKVEKGCLIYFNSIITHDCIIGKFVEISPNVTILGRCNIGNKTSIGCGAIILPDVTIGNNVIVGAGTVVLKDVPDNATIVGVPGKIISNK